MQRIILVSLNGDDNSGGVERVVYYLNIILREKYSVSILKRKGKPGKFDKLLYPLLFSIRLLFKKKAIVISNSWQSFLYPVDFSIHHGTTAGYMRHACISSKKSALLAWMEKISARCAKTVIAVSENCKRELETLYKIPPEKIIVLNNFVDERLFYPQSAEKSDKITILFSGRLEERKGLPRLLELAQAVESTDRYLLKITVNSYDNCALFANFKNTVILTNLDINAMRDFYNSGDVFYFPTKYEGFSMATLEALACGIPVIGTGFAIPEEMRRYDFVRLVESTNTENILDVIEEMKQKFDVARSQIHQTIARDFGCDQYRQKLIKIIGGGGGGICKIPKIIHYCWFGGKPLPKKAKRCIASWRKYFPDYKIIEWNESNYNIKKIPYTAEAYKQKKYAFVSDYARFDILYQYGGVYFDTDVEVIKSFDSILSNGSFLGMGQIKEINPGVGCAFNVSNPVLKEILMIYQNLDFMDSRKNEHTIVHITTSIFAKFGYRKHNSMQKIADVTIYPAEYFDPVDYNTLHVYKTINTHSIHYYDASWFSGKQRISTFIHRCLCRIFGKKTGMFLSGKFKNAGKSVYRIFRKSC
jgi:mannosyltransferase OCH1-like enzyme/glycosyltransferase involved in cell wall biosynthesis